MGRKVLIYLSALRFARLYAGGLLLMLLGWSGSALAVCPTQSFTVASGGSHQIDLNYCTAYFNATINAPSHGSLYNDDDPMHPTPLSPTGGSNNAVIHYVNNGDGALSDTFSIQDESNNVIVFNVTVGAATPTISLAPSTLNNATVNVAYSQTITASGGTAPYVYTLGAGTLPAGLSISSAGVLSGTPTASGSANFTIRATDANSVTGSHAYTMTVNAPSVTIAPSTLTAGTVGVAQSQTLTASGGTAPYAYTLASGILPAGVTLSSAGVLSGTPTAGGNFTFSIRATDANSVSGTRAYTLVINAPTITMSPSTLGTMTVGTSFSQNVVASGATAPYAYAVTSGALPAGLVLASNGTLSGTPSAAAAYSFTVTGTDSSGGNGPYTGSHSYSGSVNAGAPVAGAVSATVAYGSTANPITLSLSGGTATSVAVVSPAMNGTATASGTNITYTPTARYAGSDSFTYTATNGNGTSSPATVSLTISAPTQTITPSSSWSVVAGTSYSQTLTWSGGATPYSGYSVSGLPAGLTAANGTNSVTISGTPSAVGSFSVTASAIDNSTGNGPFTKSQTFTLTVSAPSVILSPAASTLSGSYNTAYSQVFSASGGVAPYTYALSGSLPTGVSFNASTATLSGTPTQSGSFPISVTATDHSTGSSAPYSATVSYTLTIGAAAITVIPGSFSSGTVAAAYSTNIAASGGAAPYAYSLTSGALPAGMTLNASSGVLSGTPSAAGTFNFTVSAQDANNYSGSRSYALVISAPTVTLSPSSLPAPTAESAYSTTLTAAGGTASYTYAITGGALPGGLTLNATTGVLSGTTNQSGSFSFTIKATDSSTGSGPFTGSRSYTVNVAAPTITLTPSAMTAAKVSVAYSGQLTASGGVAPYSMTVSSGSLPTGLTLSSTGLVSGTPTTAGSYSFTVSATDAHSFNGQQVVTLSVGQAQPVALNDAASTAANQAVTINVTANDSGPITSIAMTTAPSHGTATVSGLTVIYTPALNYFGSDSLRYTATGAGGTSSPATVTLTVAPLAVPADTAQSVTVLAGQSLTVHGASGATGGPFTALTIVSPPSTGTATVSGTDIVYTSVSGSSGTFRLSYTLSNPFGISAPVVVTIVVTPNPVSVTHSATTAAGTATVIDLMAGATGGPFTGAAIGSVSPSNAGVAVINTIAVSGQPSTYRMTFTPASTFAGSALVSYTLSNAYSVSALTNINITVSQRPVITTNAEVTGLVAAQVDSSRRFASTQLSNFTRRLESLHTNGWGRDDFGISMAPTAVPAKSQDSTTMRSARPVYDDSNRWAYSPLKANMRKIGWSPNRANAEVMAEAEAADANVNGLPDLPQTSANDKRELSVWTGGAIDFGRSGTNSQTASRFRTNGVSVGGEYRLSDMASVGLGLGYGHDRSDIGNDGSKTITNSVTAAMYGSLRPTKDIFIDAVLGLGTLNFDATRYLTDGGGFATGSRRGSQVFGALVSGLELRQDRWMWSPYGRLEMAAASLNEYTETAPEVSALTYFKQTVRTASGVLGVRAENQMITRFGTLFPRSRLEFRHQFQAAGDAPVAYASLAAAGPSGVISSTSQNLGNWAAGLGARLVLHNQISLLLDFYSNLSIGKARSQSILFAMEIPVR